MNAIGELQGLDKQAFHEALYKELIRMLTHLTHLSKSVCIQIEYTRKNTPLALSFIVFAPKLRLESEHNFCRSGQVDGRFGSREVEEPPT